jgi:hypothetical protein
MNNEPNEREDTLGTANRLMRNLSDTSRAGLILLVLQRA